MDQKIKELTEKIYQEGVAKGDEKAREIVNAAEGRSAAIIAEAKREAEELIAAAAKQADELKRSMEADLRLSGSQAMSSLKQQILDVLTFAVIDKPISASLAEPATIKEFLSIVLQNWKSDRAEAPGLEVLLPENRRKELENALREGLQEAMAKGLELRFSKNIKAGFQIQSQGSLFKISLTDEDFREFFKEYLRPKTRTFLFGQ